MTPTGAAALRRRLDELGDIRPSLTSGGTSGPILSLGATEIDGRFRHGGLESGTHHAAGEGAAALGFAGALLARLQRQREGLGLVVQEADAVREHGALYPPGLKALGADPDRLALVAARSGEEALKVADEGLKSGAFALVLLELRRGEGLLDLNLTRRFNMAAERCGALMILLTPGLGGTSAALTRWTVAAAPSRGPGAGLLGRPTFTLDLVKNRAGSIGAHTLEWDCDARLFRSPDLRAAAAGPERAALPARAPAQTGPGRSAAA